MNTVHSPAAKALQESAPAVDAAVARHVHLMAGGSSVAVRFFLQRVAGGLYVEREETPRRGLRTLQSVQFASAAEFERWCDGDPVRFEHPLLHDRLKRDGDALWRIESRSNNH